MIRSGTASLLKVPPSRAILRGWTKSSAHRATPPLRPQPYIRRLLRCRYSARIGLTRAAGRWRCDLASLKCGVGVPGWRGRARRCSGRRCCFSPRLWRRPMQAMRHPPLNRRGDHRPPRHPRPQWKDRRRIRTFRRRRYLPVRHRHPSRNRPVTAWRISAHLCRRRSAAPTC